MQLTPRFFSSSFDVETNHTAKATGTWRHQIENTDLKLKKGEARSQTTILGDEMW